MIKIEAKENNGVVEMSCKLDGEGLSIVLEALAIVMELPNRLEAVSPELFEMFASAFDKCVIDTHVLPSDIKGGLS